MMPRLVKIIIDRYTVSKAYFSQHDWKRSPVKEGRKGGQEATHAISTEEDTVRLKSPYRQLEDSTEGQEESVRHMAIQHTVDIELATVDGAGAKSQRASVI